MFTDKNGIAAVVIFYNPSAEVINNIISYIQQVDKLFILDNSSDPLLKNLILDNINIDYIFNGGNIGVAAALNIAAKRAYRSGYKYLLTMDQDSIVSPGSIEALLRIIYANDNIGIISPLHSNKFNTHLKKQSGIFKIPSVMTSGNILSLKAFIQAGPFAEDYFIDYVDVEYCLRLKKHGYSVLCDSNIILKHNEANLSRITIMGREIFPPNHDPIRMYYKSRNLMLLRKEYKKIYPEIISKETSLFIRNLVKLLLFEKQKLFKIKMVLLGLLDYFKGSKGKKF